MNIPLPQFVGRRRTACRACAYATRSVLDRRTGVTLRDFCTRTALPFIQIIGDPDYTCPIGKFGQAIVGGAETKGVPVVERGKIVSFTPWQWPSPPLPSSPPSKPILVSRPRGCSGCSGSATGGITI